MKTKLTTESGLPTLAAISSDSRGRNIPMPKAAANGRVLSATRGQICATALKLLLVAFMLIVGTAAQAGVNLVPANPPGYSAPLSLYLSNNKIMGAWSVRNSGSNYASKFEVGFYVNGSRVLVATVSNGLPSGYPAYGTDAPLDAAIPNGLSKVELRVNDTRLAKEDSYTDNNYVFTVNVTRGSGSGSGSGGGATPTPLTRSEATYKWPATFGYSSVSRIISRMTDMHAAQWKPSVDFINWGYTDLKTGAAVYSPSYTKGTTCYGLPYSQCDPVTVPGFLGYLPRMSGTLNWTTSAGLDCSRSIAIAMELPSNHNTTSFDTDKSSYFTSVVATGTLAKNASKIQIGDAIVSAWWGHMVLCIGNPVNGKIECLEATPGQGTNVNGQSQRWAVVRTSRSLADLDSNKCRVIRRNKLQ